MSDLKSKDRTHEPDSEKAMALALRLIHAENALHAYAAGQIDAIVGPGGNTYLLRSAQERLRLREEALSRVSQGVLIGAENRLITYANAGFTVLTGYMESEILGRNCSLLQGPATDPETIEHIRAALNAGQPFEGEVLNYRKDGLPFWNDLSITPIPGTDGVASQFIGIQRDVTERKRAELALRESEARYHSLFENMLEGYAYCRLLYEGECATDLVYLEVNHAYESLTGMKGIIGKKLSELLPEIFETNPELLATFARVTATGNPERFETFLQPLEIWIAISVYRPEKEHFVAVFDNITARKTASAALEKSEQTTRRERALLRTLIDSIPDMIFFKNRDSEFLGCNKAFETHFGRSEEELIGKNDFDLAPEAAALSYRQGDQEMFRSGRPQRIEEWLPAARGLGGFFETVKTPYFGPSGESLGLVGVSRDITERKKVAENERLIGERLKLAAEAGHVGIWEMDLATRKMEGDVQMRSLHGLPAEGGGDLLEQLNRTMHPDDLERATAEFEAAVRLPDRPLDTEFRIFRANDGCLRFIRVRATVIRNDAGEPQRTVGTNWDITEERTRETNLAQALAHEKLLVREAQAGNRAKSEFLAVMSHEIRTPMNGILGFAELLSGMPNLPADCEDYVKTIASSGEALLRIIDDILDFSRLEAGGLKIERSLFSPRLILENIHDLLGPKAGAKHLKFDVNIDEGISDHLWNDAGRVRQVLLNLAGNAVKFTDHGSITLGLRAAGAGLNGEEPAVEFFVRDTGPGIPEEQIGVIFEAFAQADSTISRRYGGTGLGLSISQNLVSLMGGTLSVRSKLGEGSEFVVALPVGVPTRRPPVIQESPSEVLDHTFATNHPLRILLVEDDPVNRKLLVLILRQLGYDPLVAHDGVHAVRIYGEEAPDCILMDLQMPRKDGLQATREIRAIEHAKPPITPVFITALTANIGAEARRECLDAGMDSYVNKPIGRAALAKMLRRSAGKNGG